MERGINRVTLIGWVGKEPELRCKPESGAYICRISLATNEYWKDRVTNEMKKKTDWHTVVSFGKLAEIISKFVRKGSFVFIEGQLKTRTWNDKEGNKKYTTEVLAKEFQLLESKNTVDEQTQESPDIDFNQEVDDIPF